MPRVLHTYPHISRGTTATFSSSTPATDYPTSDEIIRRAKSVGSYSSETFKDLHWGDFCYALAISTDADAGRVPRVAGDRYRVLLRRIIRDDVPGTVTRSIWEKRCLRVSAGLNHELLKVVVEQQNEIALLKEDINDLIATQRAFATRTESRLFDIGLYLEMNSHGEKSESFDFTEDPILGASPASPGSGDLGSDETGKTISIKSVRQEQPQPATPRPATSGQRARRRGKKGPKRLAAIQPSCGRSPSPYEVPPVAGPSSQKIESLDRRIDKAYLGRSRTMDRMLDRVVARDMRKKAEAEKRASVWPGEDDDLVVYPEIDEACRRKFLRGVSCDL